MANIKESPNYKANLGKNGFDMSQIVKFTSPCGMLLPVYYDLLLPGDKVNFGCEMFSRTPNLTSPAFVNIKNHVDWFFVPLEQLYSNIDSVLFGINDVKSSIFNTTTLLGNIPAPTYAEINQLVTDDPQDFDLFGEHAYKNIKRLSQLLGLGQVVENGAANIQTKLSTLLVCAYQKIFSDYYRLQDREPRHVESFNLDRNANGGAFSSTQLAYMFSLHYRPWKKDLFTNIVPAPLITQGDIGTISNADLDAVNNWLNLNSAGYPSKPDNVNNRVIAGNEPYSDTTAATRQGIGNALRSVVNTSNLRSMFAVEKLQEITRRAKKTYAAQVLAHFGFDVPQGVKNEVYYLGSDTNEFNIGDVVSTADTETAALGKMAGQAVAYNKQRQKSFTAPSHGILMAVYSAVPEADYPAASVDRINTYLNREDFYQPEFDRLGMQPLFQYQTYDMFDPTLNAKILGWQYRYSELKSKANKTCGGFLESLRNWTAFRAQLFDNDLKYFVINPSYLDSILPVAYSRNTTNFDTDYLWNRFDFHVFKSSVMSTYGMPNL